MENIYQKMNSQIYSRHKSENIVQRPNKLQLQYQKSKFNSHTLQKRKQQKKMNNINKLKNLTIDNYDFQKYNTSDLFNQLSIIKSHNSISYKKTNSVEPKIEIPPQKIKPNFIQKIKPKYNYIKSISKKSFKNVKKMTIEKNESIVKRRKSDNLLRKKTNKQFWFLEDPEYFEGNISSSSEIPITNIPKKKQKKNGTTISKPSTDNLELYKKKKLSNKNIIALNDLQKDLKKTMIGLSQIKELSIDKSFEENDNYYSGNKDIDYSFENENKLNKIDIENYRILQKIGNVFDSLDDEDTSFSNFYIDPNNYILIYIDIFVIISSIYHIIFIPLFLGNNIIYCRRDSFLYFTHIFQIIIDIVYIIDSILPFFTAYYNIDDVLKTDLKEISIKYLKSYFLIDFLSAIPFKTIFSIFDRKCLNKGYLNTPIYQDNIYYILITFQLLKPLKAFNNNRLAEYIKNYLNQYEHFNVYLGLYESILVFLSSLHIVACIFIFIGKNQYPGWIITFGFDNYDFFNLYFIAIYYIITTVTTVGYGDLICITPIEKLFGLFMEIVGIFAYSFALTSISHYVKEASDKKEEFIQKCEILNDIKVTHSNLSDDLYKRIHRYLKVDTYNDKKDKKIILNSLPIALRNKLVYEMYEQIINGFIFFKNFDNIDFIVSVILSFKPILAVRNDILMKNGDFVEDIIFVKIGRLALDLPILIEDDDEDEVNLPYSRSLKFNQRKNSIQYCPSVKFNRRNTLLNGLPRSKTLKRNSIVNIKLPSIKNFDKKLNYLCGNDNENEKQSENEKNEEDKFQYYRILEIQKNEHFGDILMFLNKRSPLRVKVKSRKAELFYLKKNDAIEISVSFPQIWKKINKKSLFNWEQIKILMGKVLKIFGQYEGIEEEIEQNNFFNTSFIETIDLQSIPSSIEKTAVDDEGGTPIKQINDDVYKRKNSLNTIKETKSFEYVDYHYLHNKSYLNEKINDNSNKNNKYSISIIHENNSNNNYNISNKDLNSIINCSYKDINNKNIPSDFSNNENNYYNNNYVTTQTLKINPTFNSSIKETLKINNKSNRSHVEFSDFSQDSSDLINNINSLTPYKPDEINNEIYPNEKTITISQSELIKNQNLRTPKYSKFKNSDNLSICSTEISLFIESEYENINEITNHKYSKSKIMQKKFKNMILNLDFFDGIRNSLLTTKSIKKLSNNAVTFMDSDKNVRNDSSTHLKAKKKLKSTSNLKNTKKIKIEDIDDEIFLPGQKKNKKKNLLNVINKNIERNYMNLNDPKLFYAEFFQKYFENNIKHNLDPYIDSNDEIIKKFEDSIGNSHICSLKKFKDIIKKI